MQRVNPQTSIDAYRSLKHSEVRDIYEKVMNALQVLGLASTEQIAEYLTIKHDRIWKRVSEMERLEMIYRPGTKVKTKSGRGSYQWALCKSGERTTIEKTKGKSTADHAKEIIEATKQPELF